MDIVVSDFQKRKAHRYIRASDKLPTYPELGDPSSPTSPQRFGSSVPQESAPSGSQPTTPTRIVWGVAELHEREVGSFSMASWCPSAAASACR
jgi:hypothetical protein